MLPFSRGGAPLTIRDATANNLAQVLQFQAPDLVAKQLAVAAGPFGQLCIPGVRDRTDEEWLPLLQMTADFGWPLGCVRQSETPGEPFGADRRARSCGRALTHRR